MPSVFGWIFPVRFVKESGTIESADYLRSIKDSLYVLLNTTRGERLMELDYGCNMKDIAFKSFDLNLKTYITNNIRDAISTWEKRIDVKNIEVEEENDVEGWLKIKIEYVVKSSGETDECFFDYKKE